MVFTLEHASGVHLDELHVVSDDDYGAAGFAYLHEQFGYLFSCFEVEVACRLVGEDEFGSVEYGSCYDDALLLAS